MVEFEARCCKVGESLIPTQVEKIVQKVWGRNPNAFIARAKFVADRIKYVNMVCFNKRKSWLDCVRMASDSDHWGRAYKILMRKIKTATPMVVMNVNCEDVSDHIEVPHAMLNGLLPDDHPEQESESLRDIRRVAEEHVLRWDFLQVTNDKLKLIVYRHKSGKFQMELDRKLSKEHSIGLGH